MKTISRKLMTTGSIRTPTGMRLWLKQNNVMHEVRAVATNTGYKYYFDKQGGVYSWWKGELRKQRPHKVMNKRTLLHNKNGGYQIICSGAGRSKGKADRGWLYVHRGVALAFPEICGVPNLIQNQVDHKNDDMYDNRANNLQWLSPSENTKKSKTNKVNRGTGELVNRTNSPINRLTD